MTNNYDKKFLSAINVILDHEGDYVDDPDDCGGETKFGISKRSYPHLDIPTLNLDAAKAIYYQDYWEPQRYHEIENLPLIIKLFDLAVNMGSRMAHRLIQRALRSAGNNVVEDGLLGPKTIAAINAVDISDLLAALKSEAAGYYRSLAVSNPKQRKFLKGWLNRAYS
jgi:lysozyme family protein